MFDDLRIEHRDAVLPHGTHSQFGPKRNTEFANHQHIEFSFQQAGNFCCNGHSPARKPQNHGVRWQVEVRTGTEFVCQLLSGVHPVIKHLFPHVTAP